MGKMVSKVKEQRKKEDQVLNFMSGISYSVNPLMTLKIITASSIFGEPQYYREGEFAKSGIVDAMFFAPIYIKNDLIMENLNRKTTSKIMEEAIDNALSYDFEGTIEWAEILRNEFFMRLNPQVIMIRAAKHENRKLFTCNNPKKFDEINQRVMRRVDEPGVQLTYWLFKYGSKNKIPSILKRSWAKRLSSADEYEINKYKNKGIGLIDTVRICHANNHIIDKLMKGENIEVKENKKTWEALRSQGESWNDILKSIDIGHMALLRNLRGIFLEIEDRDTCFSILKKLKDGVLTGKQFPFRYFSALRALENSHIYNKSIVCNALEECMDLSMQNVPKLKGKTMCLSDNSGSAWGCFQSEYGTVNLAEINNLSSVITAYNADEGYVGKFGDKLSVYPILKRNGVLSQTSLISANKGEDVGLNTENGIWLFFDNAINKNEHWDNIFIYSDQQAGHGGLYGLNSNDYRDYIIRKKYIDVYKLIKTYRQKVNPKVNIYTIQTAGYNNVLVPENCYRTSILYGWTGKEIIYADILNKLWDEYDNQC